MRKQLNSPKLIASAVSYPSSSTIYHHKMMQWIINKIRITRKMTTSLSNQELTPLQDSMFLTRSM